jgi:hypothetical protein
MSTKIGGYKSLLKNITVAQNVQFHRDAAGQIELFVSQVSGIGSAFESYRKDAVTLDVEFARKNKSVETDELALKDSRRDATTVQLIVRTDYFFNFPQNDEEKEAARVLKFIVDAYRDAPRKNYQAETSYLRSMVAELRSNEYALQLFELTSLVNRLDKENSEFEALYNIRTNAQKSKRELGTLTELAKKADKSFDVLIQIINGMWLMSLDNVVKSALEQIAGILNAQIHQYAIIYKRHAANIASKKKDNDETV